VCDTETYNSLGLGFGRPFLRRAGDGRHHVIGHVNFDELWHPGYWMSGSDLHLYRYVYVGDLDDYDQRGSQFDE
jgi:hypothetical protein